MIHPYAKKMRWITWYTQFNEREKMILYFERKEEDAKVVSREHVQVILILFI
jgi:hypothetical protein